MWKGTAKKNRQRISLILFAIHILFCGQNVFAQSSRAEELAQKQAEKAKHLLKYQPGSAERWVLKIQRWGLLTGTGSGFYPFLGSAYSGGGLAVGPGFRASVGDDGAFDAHGAWSIANYRLLDTSLRLPSYAGGRAITGVHAKYVHANKVSFFGIGNDSLEENEVSYTYNPAYLEITETIRPASWFSFGGGFGYLDVNLEEGKRTNVPSIEEIFTPLTAPGLNADPAFTVPSFFAHVDWRHSPGYTTKGGSYRVDGYDYNARDDQPFNFRRLDVELIQHIPVLRANQVIALRGLASFTDAEDFNEVPFFFLPKLGGGEELRGFRDFRFMDRHRMLMTVEYRWTPSKFMDMAVWYETGKVASRSSDLDFEDLHDCWGFGARFHTPASTALRMELAFSEEGTRIIFGAGPVF